MQAISDLTKVRPCDPVCETTVAHPDGWKDFGKPGGGTGFQLGVAADNLLSRDDIVLVARTFADHLTA